MNTDKLAVPISIVIAGGLIAGALYYSNIKTAEIAAKTPIQPDTHVTNDMRPVTADDHILGNPNADVVIVEYSDTECPYCKQFHPVLQRIMAEYGPSGKVAWVYRNFPIESRHPKAPKEAEALECANELGGVAKFWDYTNMIYEITPANNGLDPAQLPIIAKDIGLDVKAFTTCLDSGKYAAKIQADYQDAVASGSEGTPNSILITKDGMKTMVQGAASYESMKATIDALLQG